MRKAGYVTLFEQHVETLEGHDAPKTPPFGEDRLQKGEASSYMYNHFAGTPVKPSPGHDICHGLSSPRPARQSQPVQ